MNIFYTCDDNFVCLAGISMVSACENNRDMETIDFYLLGDGISDANRRALDGLLAPYGRTVTVIDVPPEGIPEASCNRRWPRNVYFRLFSGSLLPETVRIALYLDCDTIVTGSLRGLDSARPGRAVCGVKDCVSGYYKENAGLDWDAPYVNTGVLLMDLGALREMDMGKAVSDFFKARSGTMFFPDQDALNGIFKGGMGILAPGYNVMTILYSLSYGELMKVRRPTNYYTEEEVEEAKARPAIVHFTTFMTRVRPWVAGSDHPYAGEFERYKAMTPWRDMKKRELAKGTNGGRAVSLILMMPKFLAYPTLGFLHSVVRPLARRWRKRP